MTQTLTGLIVPVDVAAISVGQADARDVTNNSKYFAGTMNWFEKLTGDTKNAFLGSNVTRPLLEPPLSKTALEKGVHLHWALPDALTRANAIGEVGTSLKFPAAPNRWLVTRFIIAGNNPAAPTAWIVNSDILNTDPPSGQKAITLPVQETNPIVPGFRYTGKYEKFDAGWHEIPQNNTFKALTGNHLCAVSSGEAAFAAFYPNSRGVFGFADELKDVTGPANLMYVVFGWYSDVANDPLNGGKSLTGIQTNFDWTFVGDKTTKPQYTLCHGIVQDIAWNAETQYFSTGDQKKTVSAEVAIGNNAAEALSAYFQDKIHPGTPFFQKILNSFQMGTLSKFTKTLLTDQLSKLAESLHKNEFAPVNSGTIYSIVKKETKPAANQPLQREITLPPNLAGDLNLLNKYQQQDDFCRFHMEHFRWQLFADWYRIFKSSKPTTVSDALKVTQYKYSTWQTLTDGYDKIQSNLKTQLKNVKGQLGRHLVLETEPAERYWQPNEPVVVLISDDLPVSTRYGGDGRYHRDKYLVCRLSTQSLSAVKVNGRAIMATTFSNAKLPAGNSAPHATLLDTLLQEACLLNTRLAAGITGGTDASLLDALETELEDITGKALGESRTAPTTYTFTGRPPSPVAVNWWKGPENPFLPLLLHWSADYQPMLATEEPAGTLHDYPTSFFTDNYSFDQNLGGLIRLQTAPAITVDPAAADYNQKYNGYTILNTGAARTFEQQLTSYLADNPDPTLSGILDDLQNNNIHTQSLRGFNDCLLMRQQSLQLPVQVPANTTYEPLTDLVRPIIGNKNTVSPDFEGHFNPIRAGYMKLSLQVIGAYGERRDVKISKLVCAESMTAYSGKKPVASAALLPPRLAQPSRLLFRWLAANSPSCDEMNSHPATSPVCGWVLPNHLSGSLFLYNQQGKSLGTLYLTGDKSAVKWQSAPGDDQTVNQPLATVLKHENPQLSALANQLVKDAKFFEGFWRAIDRVNAFVNPHDRTSNGDLAVLVGRPLALAQASLRLETQGPAAINQSFTTLGGKKDYIDDNGFASVEFPVVVGDLNQMNDGLIGYFKSNNAHSAYDLSKFYSEGSDGTNANVIAPAQTNITLSLTPKTNTTVSDLDVAEPPVNTAYTEKLLMLVDPRAKIHATTGILPTRTIAIPQDQYTAILSTLEMTFLTTPILRPNNGLTLPLPQEQGYEWSWVKEQAVPRSTDIAWETDPAIAQAQGKAVWNYTPQTLTEGWLRLSPRLLEFNLLNPANHPLVISGQANTLTLNITNKKSTGITFNPGQLVAESDIGTGSIFYIHLGHLVADKDIPGIQFSGEKWTFKRFNSGKYGNFWAATPSDPVILASGETLKLEMSQVVVESNLSQAYVYFDYYSIDGLNNGVFEDLLTIQKKQ